MAYTDRVQRTPLWATALGGALVFTGLLKPRRASRAAPLRSPARAYDAPRSYAPPQQYRPDEERLSATDERVSATETDKSGPTGKPGAGADSPTDIPAPGWWNITKRVFHGISEDRIVAISAGVAFFVLLAIFPGIAGLISLYGLFADPAAINEHLDTLAGVVPQGGMDILRDQIESLTSQPPKALGLALIGGLGISLWSANGGMKAMIDALNVVYHEHEKRNFFKLTAASLLMTFASIAFIIVSLTTITVIPVILGYLGLSGSTEFLIRIARWPLLLVAVSLFIAAIYRFGPCHSEPHWRWITPGSLFAAIGWLVVSLLFSWYAENFGSYNKTYGSLGAVIGFMTWLWLSTIVIMIGAKLNAEVEHQADPPRE